MKVQEIMTREVHTCRPETNLAMAAMQMWDGDFGVLPVERNGRIIGLLTDRDICMAAAMKGREISTILVEEVISDRVHSCSPEDDVREALKIMRRNRVRRLPVIEPRHGRLTGILSLNDVALNARAEGGAEISAQDVEETLRVVCEHRKPIPMVEILEKKTPQLVA
jgi:CBS domain-containing protein